MKIKAVCPDCKVSGQNILMAWWDVRSANRNEGYLLVCLLHGLFKVKPEEDCDEEVVAVCKPVPL